MPKTSTPRPLNEIAIDITKSWVKVHYGAQPYLSAMRCLSTITDTYGVDPAREVINYFLCNASTFRGADARRLKAELKQHLKG